jgi:hypothetical protein
LAIRTSASGAEIGIARAIAASSVPRKLLGLRMSKACSWNEKA